MATTVIDALVMTLGLDVSGFKKGQKETEDALKKTDEASEKTSKDMEAHGKKTESAFRSAKAEVLGLLAAFGVTVGMKEFITSSIQGQAALGRLSQNLGISARELEGWGVVSKEVGGTAEDALNSLQTVAGGLAEAAVRGHSDFTDAARANGVVLSDSTGKLLNYDQVLINISRRMAQLPRQQAMWLANQLGVGSSFNLLALGPDVLQQRLQAAEGLSRVTQESTRRAQELQRQWADLQQRFKGIRDIAFAQLEPIFIRLATRFANWLDSIDWDKVAKKIEDLTNSVLRLVDRLGGWKAVAVALAAVLGVTLVGKVAALAASIGGLIGMLGGGVGTLTAFAGGLGSIGTAAAAAAAAVGAGALGAWIANKTGVPTESRPGHSIADLVGRAGLTALGAFGDQGAQDTLAMERWGALSSQQQVEELNRWRNMTTAQRASYADEHPGIARLNDKLSPTSFGQPRGLRNNNPGNLNYVGQTGATLEAGPGARFASFGSMDAGVSALIDQLIKYQGRGINTIQSIVKTWAPASDGNNVSAYVADLMKATGKGANDPLDLTDIKQLTDLVRGIARHEGNGVLSDDQVMRGLRYGAAQRAGGPRLPAPSGGVSVGAMARAAASGPSVGSSTSTSETHIGTVAVYTQATDAKGIVRDMRRELQNHDLIAQADSGLA